MGIVAHLLLAISTLTAPSYVLGTTAISAVMAALVTSIPVFIHLYSHSITFDIQDTIITVILGTIPYVVPITTPLVHRISLPVAFLTAFAPTIPTLPVFAFVPFAPMYYGLYSLPPSCPSLWFSLRHHPLLQRVLHKPDSRKIFAFLCLNLGFMGVQMGYGIYTNSLGLVSDSIHMLVDCAAIGFGLVASVLADEGSEEVEEEILEGHNHHDHRHDYTHHHEHHIHNNHHDERHHHDQIPESCYDDHGHAENHCDHTHEHAPDHQHAHEHDCHHAHPKSTGRWAKLEDLAGFANGVFLVFVCLSILIEALGRLIWPEEVTEVEQLLLVGILGLAINLVGVFSLNHGYHHCPCFASLRAFVLWIVCG